VLQATDGGQPLAASVSGSVVVGVDLVGAIGLT